MIDDPSLPPTGEPSDDPAPRRAPRRQMAWAALGVAALGVAGGTVAGVALAGDGTSPITLAASASSADDGTGSASSQDGAEDGAEDPAADPAEDPAAPDEHPAGEHHMHRPGVHGTVAGVDGTTVTVTGEDDESTSVTTDDETIVLDVAAGEVADVAEGDRVVVGGETTDAGVSARHVLDLGTLDTDSLPFPGGPGGPDGAGRHGPPPPAAGEDGDGEPDARPAPPEDAPAPPEGADGDHPEIERVRATVGEVTAVDGTSFTVTTEDGTEVVVATDDETSVTVVTEIEVADLAEGDTVGVRGEAADDGTVAADVITRGEPGEGGRGFGFGGHGPGRGGPGMRPGG